MHHDPVNLPTNHRGTPSALRRAEVTTVHPDGRVDVRLMRGRAAKSYVPVAVGVTPVAGDVVVIVDLDGDPNTPMVLARVNRQHFA